MRHVGAWIAVAAVVGVLAVAGIVVRGLNLGVEFTGGRLVEYSTSQPVSVDQARTAVARGGLPERGRAVVGRRRGDNVTVRTGQISNDEAARSRSAGRAWPGEVTKERDELDRPQPRRGAAHARRCIALAVALGAQLLYLAFRFRWTYAAAAVLAMSHDVLIVVGVFAWLGKPVDGVFLAALLTVIGYSVNDKVVVFDRIRERTRPATQSDRSRPPWRTPRSCRPCRAPSTPGSARCSSWPPWPSSAATR